MGQEVRPVMLTRIRFEAEGATPEDCRRDLYAAAERLLSAALARIYDEPESDEDFSVRMSSWVHEEIYSALSWNERVPPGQLYKGRLVIGLPVGPPEQTFTDAVFRFAPVPNTDLPADALDPGKPSHGRTTR